MNCWRVLAWVSLMSLCAAPAMAQTSTNFNLTLTTGNESYTSSNTLLLAQTGSVGSLGNATLLLTSSSPSIGSSGIMGPVQITFELAFNEIDTIAISFSESDLGLYDPTTTTITMSGGTITGGTGAYAGASGSLDLTVVKDVAGFINLPATTTGSGMLTVNGGTTPLTLTGFRGWCCGAAMRERDYFSTPITVSGSLGNATGTILGYYYLSPSPGQVTGTVTINFNNTDSLTLGFNYPPASKLQHHAASDLHRKCRTRNRKVRECRGRDLLHEY